MRVFRGSASTRVRRRFVCNVLECVQVRVCERQTAGLLRIRPSYMYSSEPRERLSEQVNNHI